jgi:hypothetical protein
VTRYAYFDGPRYILELDETELPGSAQRQDTWAWISDLANATPENQRRAGYYQITPTPRPPDTANTTTDRILDFSAWPIIREYWSPRPKTPTEQAATNATALERDAATYIDALRHGIDTMRTIIDTPNTTINTTPAPHIKTLARECIDTIRQTIRLARLTTGTTDTTTTDYGTGQANLTHEWMTVL